MPIGLSSLHLSTEYRTGDSDPVANFYVPCLDSSVLYKRAVGYFRSTIYLIVGMAVINFAKRGGKVKLICSPDLSDDDIESINQGYSNRQKLISENLIKEINHLLADKSTILPTKILATLVALDVLEIKIAIRPKGNGIYHEKVGVFLDNNGNLVSFIGSANETYSAWSTKGNFESIEVFCSWKNELDSERAIRHQSNFDKLWMGKNVEAETFDFPDAVKHHLCKQSMSTLDDIETEWANYQGSLVQKNKRSPLPHQLEAIQAWIKNNKRGILEHATGSGKTYTAIEAAREHLNSGLPLLILVPSQLLLKQWAIEIREELPECTITLAGAGNVSWKDSNRLSRITSNIPVGGRVVIATMQTAASELFRRQLTQGEHLMLIADEVHQIGSAYNSASLSIDSGPRLGLSATPQRYGDPEGTKLILDYFDGIIQPPYTLSDAMRDKRLVSYEYFPHPVNLNEEESDLWKEFTKKIGYEFAKSKNEDGGALSQNVKMLILRRSRVAKKAIGKISLAARILKDNYVQDQTWLVYCEDSDQLSLVMKAFSEVGIKSIEYHTGMDGDQKSTLDWFKEFGGVLVSIKCLDEGVDIPSISHALILASSQNPRQFIQRRGRVLRRSKGKSLAVIHDVIVVPVDIENEPEQLSLLKSELVRAIEFSDSAINKFAGAKLREMAFQMGIDFDSNRNEGVEDEEE